MSVDVVLLRSSADPDPYVQAFEAAGWTAACCPVLSFTFTHQEALMDHLETASAYSGLILTSPRAVQALAQAFEKEPALTKLWTDQPVYVVGPKTAERVKELGLEPKAEEAGQAAGLIDKIAASWEKQSMRSPMLFLSGNRRRETIPQGLVKVGIPVAEQEVYETTIRSGIEIPDDATWLTFFSPSGLEAVQTSRVKLNDYRIATIGPTTADALSNAGMPPEAVAETPTPSDLVAAISEAAASDAG
jgi:uroporphyrinogen-III synthase